MSKEGSARNTIRQIMGDVCCVVGAMSMGAGAGLFVARHRGIEAGLLVFGLCLLMISFIHDLDSWANEKPPCKTLQNRSLPTQTEQP